MWGSRMSDDRAARRLEPLSGVSRWPGPRGRVALALLLAWVLSGCGELGSDDPLGPPAVGPGTSRGMADDPQLRNIPAGATRIFFAGTTLESSVRPNALGDLQVLYYDLYPPLGDPNGTTVLYLHGGGYNVGYANNAGVVEACRVLRELGSWCISMEYRRGWHGQADGAVAGNPITEEDSRRFDLALELARTDVLDGWRHAHEVARGTHGFPPLYVVAGESAGGSLASRVTLTNPTLSVPVAGVVVGFGTHALDEPVVQDGFPVVIQGGLFDPIQPAFDGRVYFSPRMPPTKGLVSLYREVRERGIPARLLLGAQDGHGFGVYALSTGGGDHYGDALAFFRDVGAGGGAASYLEYRFRRSDPRVPEAGPGVRIRSTERPDFRYDPYQAELEAGVHPDTVKARYGLR